MTPASIANKVQQIGRIACLDELGGYETTARKRGINADEIAAIDKRRKTLARGTS